MPDFPHDLGGATLGRDGVFLSFSLWEKVAHSAG